MHQFIVNASLQILPLDQQKHPYQWVDDAIDVIRKSGIKYEVGPFATVLEGTYFEVMSVVNSVNEYLSSENCHEWIANVQIQIRAAADMSGDEKTAKYTI